MGDVFGGDIAFIGSWDKMWDEPAADYIAITRERRRTGRVVYVHTDPDDCFHSNLYSRIAFWVKNGLIQPSLSEKDEYLESELIYGNEYNYDNFD